jgi:predicted ABC-type exoprotein transport system permease subunit
MGKLSELWFRLIEKIVNLIFLYIFCWWILRPFFDHLKHTIIQYLNHLSANSSNEGYSALKTMVRYVIDIIEVILYVIPILRTLMLLPKENRNKK